MANEFKTQEELIAMVKSNEHLMKVIKHLCRKFNIADVYVNGFTMNFNSRGDEVTTLRTTVISNDLNWKLLKEAVHEVEPCHDFTDNCDPMGFSLCWDTIDTVDSLDGCFNVLEGIRDGLF